MPSRFTSRRPKTWVRASCRAWSEMIRAVTAYRLGSRSDQGRSPLTAVVHVDSSPSRTTVPLSSTVSESGSAICQRIAKSSSSASTRSERAVLSDHSSSPASAPGRTKRSRILRAPAICKATGPRIPPPHPACPRSEHPPLSVRRLDTARRSVLCSPAFRGPSRAVWNPVAGPRWYPRRIPLSQTQHSRTMPPTCSVTHRLSHASGA